MAKKINQEILQLVKSFKQDLQKHNLNINQILIFGSQVKGTTHPDSDIDIAIISPDLTEDYGDNYIKLTTLNPRMDIRIEPHGFTPEDFEDKWNPLAREIKKHGILIE